jgi:hypothetical protein
MSMFGHHFEACSENMGAVVQQNVPVLHLQFIFSPTNLRLPFQNQIRGFLFKEQ